MYITREELNVFYYHVHSNVAKKLGVKDFEWKSTNELSEDIRSSNSQVASRVNSFIEAYEVWFKVHQDIDNTGSSGNLKPEQNKKLMKAIKERDSARSTLIYELQNL